MIFVVKYGPETLEMHLWWVCLLYSVKVKSCLLFFYSTGQRLLKCTLGGSACCIQLKLKVVHSSFTVRARGSWDAWWVCLCTQLDLKVVDSCFTVRARGP